MTCPEAQLILNTDFRLLRNKIDGTIMFVLNKECEVVWCEVEIYKGMCEEIVFESVSVEEGGSYSKVVCLIPKISVFSCTLNWLG